MRRFAYLPVFQVLDLGGVVAVSLPVAQHLESGHADGVHHGAAVGEELHIPHLRDGTISLVATQEEKSLTGGVGPLALTCSMQP